MNILKAHDFKGKKVIDSREVAEMVGRSHNELLKSIRTYSEYLGLGNFPQSDFFIESTYLNIQNREMPNFLITKKGCDMIANKLTGKKGVLFTAAYVTAFEEMAEQLKADHVPYHDGLRRYPAGHPKDGNGHVGDLVHPCAADVAAARPAEPFQHRIPGDCRG